MSGGIPLQFGELDARPQIDLSEDIVQSRIVVHRLLFFNGFFQPGQIGGTNSPGQDANLQLIQQIENTITGFDGLPTAVTCVIDGLKRDNRIYAADLRRPRNLPATGGFLGVRKPKITPARCRTAAASAGLRAIRSPRLGNSHCFAPGSELLCRSNYFAAHA
ncbi:MAG: hypothetical protein MPJ78_15580 [Hyphomicrobiaceae bacterium]|nr:hypothetical protein [Hyphomicrobiaceae bacterium]